MIENDGSLISAWKDTVINCRLGNNKNKTWFLTTSADHSICRGDWSWKEELNFFQKGRKQFMKKSIDVIKWENIYSNQSRKV